jgi:hypothetical protein
MERGADVADSFEDHKEGVKHSAKRPPQ